MKETLKNTILILKLYIIAFCKWLVLGVLMGAASGGIGTLFSKTISFATNFREHNFWLIFLLPLGGLLSAAVYKLLRVENQGTNQVLESVRSDKKVSFLLAPAVFIGSAITHLCGGSAGREGAALQLGGGVASFLGKTFKFNEKTQHILTLCGMGAFFSAIFGTPLGACVFALEVVSVGNVCLSAIFPCLISSVTAYAISGFFGVKLERFNINFVPELSFGAVWRVAIVAVVCAIVSLLFCHALHFSEKAFKKWFKNDFLRIFIGGVAISLLTIIIGTTDYNGGGIEVIERIFSVGMVKNEAFILKIIFTCLTVAAGYKGGEIIPTFFIGATLGGAISLIIGLDPAFGAAVGMAALFCGVTNCPLATLFLATEMFGAQGLIFFALSVSAAFLLSGNTGLYSSQKLVFSKLSDEHL